MIALKNSATVYLWHLIVDLQFGVADCFFLDSDSFGWRCETE